MFLHLFGALHSFCCALRRAVGEISTHVSRKVKPAAGFRWGPVGKGAVHFLGGFLTCLKFEFTKTTSTILTIVNKVPGKQVRGKQTFIWTINFDPKTSNSHALKKCDVPMASRYWTSKYMYSWEPKVPPPRPPPPRNKALIRPY